MFLLFVPKKYNSVFLKNKNDPIKRHAKILYLRYTNSNGKIVNVQFKENTPVILTDVVSIQKAEYGLENKIINVLPEINQFFGSDLTNDIMKKYPVCKPKKGAGFFSCCSVLLSDIVGYYNKYKFSPYQVNTNNQFKRYITSKLNTGNLIRGYIFKNSNETPVIINERKINYVHSYQYSNYKKINIDKIIPLVKKYFSPSKEIETLCNSLIRKYNITFNKAVYCGVYYRGTDKWKETKIMKPEDYIKKMLEIQGKNKNIIFIVQTDSQKFVDNIKKCTKLNRCIFFDENKTSNTNKGTHHTFTNEINFNQIKYCISIFLILAKCNYIIMGTGNCSIWITFFREHARNIYQSNNNKWLS